VRAHSAGAQIHHATRRVDQPDIGIPLVGGRRVPTVGAGQTFDNPKTVVLARDAYGPGLYRWNERLRELAEQCGFVPRLCRP